MDINEIGRWIADNESLLSGLAALVVLAGVIFSPLGKGARRLAARYQAGQTPATGSAEAAPEGETRPLPALGADTAAATEPLLAVLAFDNLSSALKCSFSQMA